MRVAILSLVFAVSGFAQDLDISIRPDVVYVEQLEGNIQPTRRAFFHVLFHNTSDEPIEILWTRFDLVGTTGGIVSGQFSGQSLTALFDDSIARRRIEVTPTGTLVLGPDERKTVSDVFLAMPSGMMGETVIVETEFRAGDRVATRKVTARVVPAEGFAGRLPIQGIWYVAAEHGALDPHKRFVAEAFAYDFLKIGGEGRSYEGSGGRNSDYFAYGAPVLAAADGEVVYMKNDVPENVPGQAMAATPGGNSIVIRHEGNIYTYYAHMRPSGMQVGVGDTVVAGDAIGEVGNSGDSVEPHLHFHAMSGPDAGQSAGIPALFENWISEAYGRRAVIQRMGTLPKGIFVEQPD